MWLVCILVYTIDFTNGFGYVYGVAQDGMAWPTLYIYNELGESAEVGVEGSDSGSVVREEDDTTDDGAIRSRIHD